MAKKTTKKITNNLKANFAVPITHLKTAEGITTEPYEIDKIMINTWHEITKGNIDDPEKHADKFIEHYDMHIPKKQQEHVKDIETHDLRRVLKLKTSSAPGMDGWSTKDLGLVSYKALSLLTLMLNCIETKGHQWPKSTLQARAVFLPNITL